MTGDRITINGYRIHVHTDRVGTYGAFYQTDSPREVPLLVLPYYCAICAQGSKQSNQISRDGERDCGHKSLLRFAVKVLNGDDDEGYYRELRSLRAAAANGTL